MKQLRRENRRILESMDNNSDAIDIASEDNASTAEQILKLMKPHIEEKNGVESEAAKILTEAIRGVMRSVDQHPQYPTVLLQYATQLASQVSKSAYEKTRQLLLLTTRKMQINANKNLIIGKYGTIKEGYQVHAIRGCHKLSKDKGWINPKNHKKMVLFCQRCNDNQEGSNYFYQ